MELILKKCLKCGALVEILHDCNCNNCGITCCGEKMTILKPIKEDNQLIIYEIIDNEIIVKADKDIKWVAFVNENKIGKKFINDSKISFPYEKGSKLYAYNNRELFEYDID